MLYLTITLDMLSRGFVCDRAKCEAVGFWGVADLKADSSTARLSTPSTKTSRRGPRIAATVRMMRGWIVEANGGWVCRDDEEEFGRDTHGERWPARVRENNLRCPNCGLSRVMEVSGHGARL